MKPESILQTDLLDIIFDNRNKDYGAYMLRKKYNVRLSRAVAVTFSLAFLLCVSWYVQAKYFKSSTSIVAGEHITDMHLKKIDEIKKPEVLKSKRLIEKKTIAKIANPPIVIVPDDKADKKVRENKELDNKRISSITTEGNVDIGEIPALPTEEGNKNGGIIEPKKIEPPVEIVPLLHADVMPEFPGGMEAFKKYMLRNLREPDDLPEGEKVVVLIKFIVEADGTIVNAEVLKSGGRFDDEVLKVVRKMPRWKPGIQDGKFVSVYFSLPVTFAGADN